VPAKITYYAVVGEFGSRERPSGVIRRIIDETGHHDQAFTRTLNWERTGTLHAYEQAEGGNKLYEIGEAEAYEIVARIRRAVTGE
jgi:hypothetical protein